MDNSNIAPTFVEGRNALDLEKRLDRIRVLNKKRLDIISISTSAPWIAWFYTDQVHVPLQYRVRAKEASQEVIEERTETTPKKAPTKKKKPRKKKAV